MSESTYTAPNNDGQIPPECHPGSIHSPTKPWYLSTKSIFRLVNRAAMAVVNNKQVEFDQSVFGIKALTNIIRQKTQANNLVIDFETAHELMEKLDRLRSDQFVPRKDGLDGLRGRFAGFLKSLIASIAEQRALAADILSQQAASNGGGAPVSQESATPVAAQESLRSSLENIARLLVNQLKTHSPTIYNCLAQKAQRVADTMQQKSTEVVSAAHTVHEKVQQLRSAGSKQAVLTAAELLRRAHPYAHSVYVHASNAAHRGSQLPVYRNQVQPIMNTLLSRAEEARLQLQQHGTVGPYATKLVDSLYAVLHVSDVYCATSNAEAAVYETLLKA